MLTYDIVELLVKNSDVDLILWFGNNVEVEGVNSGESEEGLLDCELVPVFAYSLECVLANGLDTAVGNERAAEIMGYQKSLSLIGFKALDEMMEKLKAILLKHALISEDASGEFAQIKMYPEAEDEFDADMNELSETYQFDGGLCRLPFGCGVQVAAARYVRENYELFLPRLKGHDVQDLYAAIR